MFLFFSPQENIQVHYKSAMVTSLGLQPNQSQIACIISSPCFNLKISKDKSSMT